MKRGPSREPRSVGWAAEMADRGTIFLDEVSELLPDTQAALLRVLQEREIQPSRGRMARSEVRCSRYRCYESRLEHNLSEWDRRQDLTLSFLECVPDRNTAFARTEERHFDAGRVLRAALRQPGGQEYQMVDQKTLDLLQSYDWPGNIRELQNVIERSIILSSTDVFSVDELWLQKDFSAGIAGSSMHRL